MEETNENRGENASLDSSGIMLQPVCTTGGQCVHEISLGRVRTVVLKADEYIICEQEDVVQMLAWMREMNIPVLM